MDDRTAREVAGALDSITEKRAAEAAPTLFLFAILAGVYIGFGAIGFTAILSGDTVPTALTRFLASSVFCVGLILVIVAGSELFTGNILMTAGLFSRKVSAGRVLRNWMIVYTGNFVGAILLAVAMYFTGIFGSVDSLTSTGATVVQIAETKMGLPFAQAFTRGILCNMLVCLAIIITLSSRTIIGKIIGLYLPIMLFVLAGFEHSVANMYLLPAGLLAKGNLGEFLGVFHNLVPVTLGNIVGGMLVVGLHPARAKKLGRIFGGR